MQNWPKKTVLCKVETNFLFYRFGACLAQKSLEAGCNNHFGGYMSPTHIETCVKRNLSLTRPQLRHQLVFDDLETFAVQLGVWSQNLLGLTDCNPRLQENKEKAMPQLLMSELWRGYKNKIVLVWVRMIKYNCSKTFKAIVGYACFMQRWKSLS